MILCSSFVELNKCMSCFLRGRSGMTGVLRFLIYIFSGTGSSSYHNEASAVNLNSLARNISRPIGMRSKPSYQQPSSSASTRCPTLQLGFDYFGLFSVLISMFVVYGILILAFLAPPSCCEPPRLFRALLSLFQRLRTSLHCLHAH